MSLLQQRILVLRKEGGLPRLVVSLELETGLTLEPTLPTSRRCNEHRLRNRDHHDRKMWLRNQKLGKLAKVVMLKGHKN